MEHQFCGLTINEETGEVEKLSVSRIDSDEETPNATKFHIKIEITWTEEGFKIVVTVTL